MTIPNRRRATIKELKSDLNCGKLNRREFLRLATLLGLSNTAAYQVAGTILSPETASAQIKANRPIRVATSIPKIGHPAQLSCVEGANILRNIAEYLTFIDENNVAHPYLLKGWQASGDLKTWTLNLRKGIQFNNGDRLTADDVVFSMNQWLTPDGGTFLYRMMANYLHPDGIEKTGRYQIKLHLKRAELGVPELLFHPAAVILNHKTFKGDFIKAPHGTGPYKLSYYREGEGVGLERCKGYWQKGSAGSALQYPRHIEFVDMRAEGPEKRAAQRANEIDFIDLATTGGRAAYGFLRDGQKLKLKPIGTARNPVLRIRVDTKPWNDKRVRMALKLCNNRPNAFGIVFWSRGFQGHHYQVNPTHTAYRQKPVFTYDPQRARRLLNEAGYANGLNMDLTVSSNRPDLMRFAKTLKNDTKPAGFRVNIQTRPSRQYWEEWTRPDLLVTPWTYRPREQKPALTDKNNNKMSFSWMGILMAV